MPQFDANRRFQAALDRARADWAAADPARCAARAGCQLTPQGIIVPYFGRAYRVTHPDGEVIAADGKPAHASIVIVLLHYLLTADGTAPADRWITFRELPDGLFYAQAFAGHAEGEIARRFGADPSVGDFAELAPSTSSPLSFAMLRAGSSVGDFAGQALQEFRQACVALAGTPLDLADASFRFQALPRLPVAALLWAGDDEFPGQARILFDANAGHYLPTEDLAGIGDWLAHKLCR